MPRPPAPGQVIVSVANRENECPITYLLNKDATIREPNDKVDAFYGDTPRLTFFKNRAQFHARKPQGFLGFHPDTRLNELGSEDNQLLTFEQHPHARNIAETAYLRPGVAKTSQ